MGRPKSVDARRQPPMSSETTSPHPSGMNRADRRRYAKMEEKAARLDSRGSRHIAALQETRTYWCEDGGPNCPGQITHLEVYCANCSHRLGRPVYELRDEDAKMHPEWEGAAED